MKKDNFCILQHYSDSGKSIFRQRVSKKDNDYFIICTALHKAIDELIKLIMAWLWSPNHQKVNVHFLLIWRALQNDKCALDLYDYMCYI